MGGFSYSNIIFAEIVHRYMKYPGSTNKVTDLMEQSDKKIFS
jgi:hypothetical protein